MGANCNVPCACVHITQYSKYEGRQHALQLHLLSLCLGGGGLEDLMIRPSGLRVSICRRRRRYESFPLSLAHIWVREGPTETLKESREKSGSFGGGRGCYSWTWEEARIAEETITKGKLCNALNVSG